jgi:hypothetical protein
MRPVCEMPYKRWGLRPMGPSGSCGPLYEKSQSWYDTHPFRGAITDMTVCQVTAARPPTSRQAAEQCRVGADYPVVDDLLIYRTTGITASVVERMEQTLKHDEVETKPGAYEIIPIWEAVEESDVMTPKELYEMITKEAYQVDYERVAVVRDLQSGLTRYLQYRPTSKLPCQPPSRRLFDVLLPAWKTVPTLCTQH